MTKPFSNPAGVRTLGGGFVLGLGTDASSDVCVEVGQIETNPPADTVGTHTALTCESHDVRLTHTEIRGGFMFTYECRRFNVLVVLHGISSRALEHY
jgi:hypothetical protein